MRYLLVVALTGLLGCPAEPETPTTPDAVADTATDSTTTGDSVVADADAADVPTSDAALDAVNSDVAEEDAVADVGADVAEDASADAAGDAGEDVAQPSSPVPYTAGSRLAPITMSFPDGPARLLRWRDTQLDMDCDFERTGDGTYHCVPSAAGFSVWADAACTQPIVLPPQELACSGAAAPSEMYLRVPTEFNCGLGETKVLRGTSFSAGPLTYYEGVPGDCFPVQANFGAYMVSEEADLSTLVAATAEHWPGPGDVGLRRFEAEDGASETVTLVDNGRDLDCLGEDLYSAGPWSCRSERTAYVRTVGTGAPNEVVQGTCDGPLAGYDLFAGCTDLPKLALQFNATTCGIETTLFDVAKQLDTSEVLLKAQDLTCSPAGDNQRYYELGGEAVLPELSEGAFEGTGRIETFVGHGALVTKTHRDTSTNEPCTVLEVGPDDWRCIPSSTAQFGGDVKYLDAACTMPALAVFNVDGCPTDIPAISQAWLGSDSTCSTGPYLEFRPTAANSTATEYYELGEECSGPYPADAFTIVELGEALPLSTFEQATIAVEQ